MTLQNVAIVGGGPIGLYSAIVLRYKHPYAKITIFEKREHYSRDHRVQIDNLKLLNPPQTINGLIPIKFLERVLKERLQCVDIIVKDVNCFQDIRQHIPTVTDVFFADGAHSKARVMYFGGEQERITYAHACSIRYTRSSDTLDYLTFEHNYRVSKLIDCHLVESVKGTSIHLTLISRQTVTENDWNKKMCLAINVRRIELKEKVATPPTLSTYSLQLYTAAKFHNRIDDCNLYLVGDAAIGLPYECGLAAGLKCVRALLQDQNTYPQRVKEIQDSFLTKIERRNTLLTMYLGFSNFWKGTIFEWQRWSRPFERLLLETKTILDDSLLTHQATINRHLILDRLF